METTTPFDLNSSIRQWRENLAQSPAIRAENLDELETHLRDSVTILQSRELSAEEAFLIATKRVGSGAALEKEFGKMNNHVIWVDRLFWAVIIFLTWTAVYQICIQLVSSLFSLLHAYASMSAFFKWEILEQVYGAILSTSVLAALVWYLSKQPKGKFRACFDWLSKHPSQLALAIFVVTASVYPLICWWTLRPKIINGHEYPSVLSLSFYFSDVPTIACFSLALFFIARKRLLRKA